MFLKCWQHRQLFSGAAIFKEYLSLAATVYYLSDLNQNLWCLRILQIILLILLKTPNQGHLKRIFNSNILWNLVFVIFDFTRCKTLVHSTRFLYSSLMRTKQNQIYLLWFTFFTVLCKFCEKSTPRLFFPKIDTDRSETNFRLSQFLQIKEKKFISQNIPLHAFNLLRPGDNERSYILKQTCSQIKAAHLYDHCLPPETHTYVCISGYKKSHVSRRIFNIY